MIKSKMEEPKITPLARRLAEENGIDWRKLQGSGPEGTIVERDILAFLAKVMAGEVDLPPAPEPPPPPPPSPPDLERAKDLLAKEGVPLEEVLPRIPKSTEPPEVLDDLEDLIDLDLELEDAFPEEKPLEELPPEEIPEEVEAALLTWPEHAPPEGAFPEEKPLEAWEVLPEEEPKSASPIGEHRVASPIGEHQKETALWSSPLEEAEAFTPGPAMGLAPGPSLPESPAPALGPIRVHRIRLELAPAQRAREVLSEAWGREVGLPALLVQAAAKALDELRLPYAALLGRLEGLAVKGHLLPPGGLRALVFGEEGPEGEGLFCLVGEEEVHTGTPLLYLHEEGLLTLSGPFEPASARALLERVKAYLEEPLLLFA